MTPRNFQPYAELCVTSNFTFLTGASHPEELITRAAELGLAAIAITDRNSVAGVVRAYSALKELARLREEAKATAEATQDGPTIRSQRVTDHSSRQTVPHFNGATEAPSLLTTLPKLIAGARLVLTDSTVEWVALPTDLAAWSRLTRLLSLGKRRAPKGECHLRRADLTEWGQGMILIALPPDPLDDARPKIARNDLLAIARAFPGQCFLGAAPRYDGCDQAPYNGGCCGTCPNAGRIPASDPSDWVSTTATDACRKACVRVSSRRQTPCAE